ncbi:hypothetical protein Tco_0519244 [Tanacetum coccineum]
MTSFNQRECKGCGQPCDGFYCYLFTCQQCGVKFMNGICLNCTYGDGKPVTCCGCEGALNSGFCSFCASRAGNSFAYDPNSFNDSQNLSDYPPQYQTYSYELCRNDAHYGYDCPPQVPFILSIVSSPKFDSLLKEFSGELAHIDLISPEIDEADFDPEDEIHLSFSPSPIPVEDSDTLMEEIDIFLAPDDSIPPGIENDDYYSKGDILFLEELLSNDSLPLPENESFHFNRNYVPSSPRPPAKPPDDVIYFDIVPDTGVFTKVLDDISELHVLMIAPDFEDSRARGFVHRSLDLQSFTCLYRGIRYPRSY